MVHHPTSVNNNSYTTDVYHYIIFTDYGISDVASWRGTTQSAGVELICCIETERYCCIFNQIVSWNGFMNVVVCVSELWDAGEARRQCSRGVTDVCWSLSISKHVCCWFIISAVQINKTFSASRNSYDNLWSTVLLVVVYLHAAPQVLLFTSVCNGRLHNAPWYH